MAMSAAPKAARREPLPTTLQRAPPPAAPPAARVSSTMRSTSPRIPGAAGTTSSIGPAQRLESASPRRRRSASLAAPRSSSGSIALTSCARLPGSKQRTCAHGERPTSRRKAAASAARSAAVPGGSPPIATSSSAGCPTKVAGTPARRKSASGWGKARGRGQRVLRWKLAREGGEEGRAAGRGGRLLRPPPRAAVARGARPRLRAAAPPARLRRRRPTPTGRRTGRGQAPPGCRCGRRRRGDVRASGAGGG
mmetsp:Transcript_34561/g.111007  ORF Transcript_34561/g.111007 Transcript_34561/m.111007 type:complete len:251 (-) Transcript_34561:385-1137(-)